MMAEKPKVTLTVKVLHRNRDAWLVADAAGATAWLPLQWIVLPEGDRLMGTTRITIPAWLAAEKGFSAGAAAAGQGSLFGGKGGA